MAKLILTMLQSSLVSLEVFFLTLLFSIPLALPITMARVSKFKPLSMLANAFLLIIRGTPLMLQLIVVYFGPFYLFKFSWDRFTAAIIALSVNYACYFAEIYRGGLQSISVGQYEAAKVLGYTKTQTFFKIVLPQVVKRIVPPMGNEVITLVKDTALVSVIGVVELLRTAQTHSSRLFSTTPIFIAGVFYFLMNWVVTAVFIHLEKKLDYYK
ncbi:MAG: amino acid ABC transporter permease [Spirochaetales bacterium]|nr:MULTISPECIES: amino acid ABC transporter permease [Treponema]MDO5767404.1 amino acid ABC transporter permease [Spirochaetales bacterium]MBQ9103186.1 amino acid ABC transporter permease [Treponema sp.]MCI5541069.1 amino acid ABC transporter permease [Treponema berlinense]MDD5834281.1 amino acid ABC transporter permease [Treponema berlinense]MDY3707698.1 amino acid ABC transporter permease [Treponema berlinense]